MDWFMSKAKKKRRAALANLVYVMLSDGEVDENELAFLDSVRRREGMEEKEFIKMMKNPKSIKFVQPETEGECSQQMFDVICMMLADGKIEDDEMDMVMRVAMMLGYSPSAVPEMVKAAISLFEDDEEKEGVDVEVDGFLDS